MNLGFKVVKGKWPAGKHVTSRLGNAAKVKNDKVFRKLS